MNNIWGLSYEEETDGQITVWRAFVRNPFKQTDGKWRIGVNEKFLRKAEQNGVAFILLMVGEQEFRMSIPSKKVLNLKQKRGEYEMIPSRFADSKPMLIYHFTL